MALDRSGLPFWGNAPESLIGDLFFQGRTFFDNIDLITNVVGSVYNFPVDYRTNAALQEYSCDPEANTCADTATYKSVSLCPYQIYKYICWDTFRDVFTGKSPWDQNQSFSENGVPNTNLLYQGWVTEVLKKAMSDLIYVGFRSNTTGSPPANGCELALNLCEGLIQELEADADVIDVTLSAVTNTATLLTALQQMNAAKTLVMMDNEVNTDMKLQLWVPLALYPLFQQLYSTVSGYYQGMGIGSGATAGNAVNGLWATSPNQWFFYDMPIIFRRELLLNANVPEMIITYEKNITGLTNAFTDWEVPRLVDERYTTNRSRLSFNYALQWKLSYKQGRYVILGN